MLARQTVLEEALRQRIQRQGFRITEFRNVLGRYQEAEVVNATVRSQQHQEHPQLPIEEEVRSLHVEVNPPSLIEGSRTEMKAGEPLTGKVMYQEGQRVEP